MVAKKWWRDHNVADEMVRWQNGTMTKWYDDKMVPDKMVRWQNDGRQNGGADKIVADKIVADKMVYIRTTILYATEAWWEENEVHI